MLSRTLSLVPLARRAVLPSSARITAISQRYSSHDKPPEDYRFPTMDDMVEPCGSWQEHYDNCQRKYNIHLLFGIGFFTLTFVVGKVTGALDLYFLSPERPQPRK